MALLLLLLLLLLLSLSVAAADEDVIIGLNIGFSMSSKPSSAQVVSLLKDQNIKHVRLFDADHGMLIGLKNTGISVIISVTNSELIAIGQSNATAANWVQKNVVAFYPTTHITAIAVGSEVLTSLPNAAPVLVNALKFIHSALVAANLNQKIKVSTPHSSSIIVDSFPPSQASFNSSFNFVLDPMFKFLKSTDSPLMINVYPYYDYMQSNGTIPLEYALFRGVPPNKEAVDSNTLLHYTNVFDAVLDAAFNAMAIKQANDTGLYVMETGWPSKGNNQSEKDATIANAAAYISNLIQHISNKNGTPAHPGTQIPTFIYELYNEDLSSGSVSEKNWGLFYPNGVPVYTLDLAGSGQLLAHDTSNQTYCVAKTDANASLLQAALDWACGPGLANCSALLLGHTCYSPNTVMSHASYAFDSYYQKSGKAAGACDFKNVASITTTDPSYGTCVYPGSNKSGTGNGSSPAPSSHVTDGSLHFSGPGNRFVVTGILLLGLFFLF